MFGDVVEWTFSIARPDKSAPKLQSNTRPHANRRRLVGWIFKGPCDTDRRGLCQIRGASVG